VTTILNAAYQSTYDVFLPVLVQAYCGCRVSEIVDATTHDIVQIDGQWCLEIRETHREQGQTIKGHRSRTVPLHDEVVRYLIPYWGSLPPGPLFPKLPKAKKNNARSAYVARKIQQWIREDLQIKDRNLAPNHSFRHYLKSQLLDRDVQERISDAITGHKTPGSAAWLVVTGLAIFGFAFAVISSLHSYLILAYAGSKKAAEDVGFYYAANAAGRLFGIVMSGLSTQYGGLPACLWGSAAMLALCLVFVFLLPAEVAPRRQVCRARRVGRYCGKFHQLAKYQLTASGTVHISTFVEKLELMRCDGPETRDCRPRRSCPGNPA